MGNNYGNLDSYDYYQNESFIPISFAPQVKESKKEEMNQIHLIQVENLVVHQNLMSLQEKVL